MRLNGQFGYVYGNALTKTGAHELGHGIFKLEHPWSKYNTTQGSTDLLMDYGNGTILNHLDWKQINDPTLAKSHIYLVVDILILVKSSFSTSFAFYVRFLIKKKCYESNLERCHRIWLSEHPC